MSITGGQWRSDPKTEGLNYKYYSIDGRASEHYARVFAIGNTAALWGDVNGTSLHSLRAQAGD